MAAQVRTVRVATNAQVTALGNRTNVAGWNLVAAAANATASIFNNTDGSGDPIEELATLAATNSYVPFAHYAGGGLEFTAGVYVKLSGAGAVVYLHYY